MRDPVLFLVPARAGSRRIPGKNLAPVAGIPLVARAIRAARRAARRIEGGPHAVICSSDSEEIRAVAERWGAEPWSRPRELATDEALAAAVAIDALDGAERRGRRFRAVVLVQPTSPFVAPDDIVRAIDMFDHGASAVVTAVASHPASWHLERRGNSWARASGDGGDGARFLLAGSVYVRDPARLRATGTWYEHGLTIVDVGPETCLDVDEPFDLILAESIARARHVSTFEVEGRQIGPGASCFVIAEAGVNHNGDIGLAHRLVEAAAASGADAVKFQTFQSDLLAAPRAGLADYQRDSMPETMDQREMLRGLQLDRAAHLALQAHAADRGITFLSSAFDEPSVSLLADLGVPAFKIPSGELTNLAYLRRIASLGRPMLVSTGMAEMVEVADALDAIEDAGAPPVALLHCVSSYPARAADANLRAIDTLRSAFGVPTGWSDHTEGAESSLASVALGAALIEKHLTLDRSLPGPDHRASMEPTPFRDLVAAIRTTTDALGTGDKRPTDAERVMRGIARKSLHWAHRLPAQAVVRAEDFLAMRPGTGVEPRHADRFVGRVLHRDAEALAPVSEEDFEECR
jgi:N-acetylneuraminate synthase/N,N'-diacetyllegionaminate synthase